MALSLFQRRLGNAPNRPGVYIMKDVRGNVLYVGKASVLSNRLRNYFGSPANLPNKIRRMLGQLDDFECIVTDTEAEALILENTLIKRHKPRYNARLKDDKTYPYRKIDWPRISPRSTSLVRSPKMAPGISVPSPARVPFARPWT